MRTVLPVAALALLLVACGSDDEEAKPPPAQCSSDMKLSGGVTVDSNQTFDCPEASGYTRTSQSITVVARLPGDQPGAISANIFGLEEATAPGTALPTGLRLELGVPPTERWEAAFDAATACSSTIEAQAAQPTEGVTIVTASISCSEALTSATVGSTPVSVERLRFASEYGQ